jgi:hypothetical protein
MLWKREADKAPTNPRHNPAKQYSAKIRRPELKDGDLADRCERARIELKQRPALDAGPTEPTYSGPIYGDEEPF